MKQKPTSGRTTKRSCAPAGGFSQKETKGTKVKTSSPRSDESQRDSAPKPRVARNEPPWVAVRQMSSTPTGLRPPCPNEGRNPVGVDHRQAPITQGSSCLATLGWRTESRWDWPMAGRGRWGFSPNAPKRTKATQGTEAKAFQSMKWPAAGSGGQRMTPNI